MGKLEEVESKARKHEKEKVVLEEELRILTNNLKSLECAKDKSCKKEEVLGDKVKIMISKSNEMAAEKLQDEVERLQETLRETKLKNVKAEEEMEVISRFKKFVEIFYKTNQNQMNIIL